MLDRVMKREGNVVAASSVYKVLLLHLGSRSRCLFPSVRGSRCPRAHKEIHSLRKKRRVRERSKSTNSL